MQVKDVTVRVQTLDGFWETVGVDRLRGVVAENVSLNSNEWGSAKASCDLRRSPGAIFPDIGAFTPIEFEVGGSLVWSGRISETPIREGDQTINLQAEGWQYHLDDDTFQRTYIATRLSDFKDSRSIGGVNLNLYRAAGNVANDKGLVMGWGQGENVRGGVQVGATYDMGPGNTCAVVIYELTWANLHSAAMEFWIIGTVASATPSGTDNVTVATVTLTATTNETAVAAAGVTLSTACRYIHVFVKQSGADSAGLAGEVYARLRSIGLYADATYTASGSSRLSPDVVVGDALTRGTLLLSGDRTGIDTTNAFFFPEFALDGQKSVRETWQAANAPMGWLSKIDVNRRPIFTAKPVAPRIEIGAWPGSTFDDASANSGDQIYNRVIVEGQGPDGEKLSVARSQAQQAGVTLETISSPAPDNPSFATNTTTWTPSSGTTLTRDTTIFDTSPASGRWDRGVGVALQTGDTLTETLTGTFLAGATYVLTFKLRPSAAPALLIVEFGASRSVAEASVAGAFMTATVAWTPVTTTSSTALRLTAATEKAIVAAYWHADSLVLTAAKPTLVDRRGFRRTHVLPVKSSLTDALGQQVGDAWLKEHKTTPLKGTVQITGDRATREILTGAKVPPERLLTMTGDLLRLAHRTDPDDGSHGRDGRIAEVTYVPLTDTATVAIDSTRTKIEALLERLSAVVGSR